MRVWLVNIGEPLPLFYPSDRLHRTGILTDYLLRAGHDVVWWSSTFDHAHKRHEADGDQRVEVGTRLTYRLLHGMGYSRNVSVRRILNHWQIGRRFRALADSEAAPDIILCSFPTIELSSEAVQYGRRRGVPVVVDIRDLWPDVMLETVPHLLAPVGRLALIPYRTITRRALRNATALFGITPAFVEWGAEYAGRKPIAADRSFPLANDISTPSADALEKAQRRWSDLGLRESDFVACFVGVLGTRSLLDLDTVIRAAKETGRTRPDIKFVICGTGDSLDYYRQAARDCDNVVLPGWIDRAGIWTLTRRASVGLVPYASTFSFVRSYPNKVIEYFSAGLPIVSSLDGALAGLLWRTGSGITHPNQDSEALTRILLDLAASPSRIEEMRQHAREIYQVEFHPDKVYGGMVEHLEWLQKTHSEH